MGGAGRKEIKGSAEVGQFLRALFVFVVVIVLCLLSLFLPHTLYFQPSLPVRLFIQPIYFLHFMKPGGWEING